MFAMSGGCQKRPKKMPVYFMDGPIRTSIEVQLYHTRTDREWEEQFMHQALEEAQLENSKLGNFAARKRCYQFRWQEICIRHLLKVYTVYKGAVLSNVEKCSMYRMVYVKSINQKDPHICCYQYCTGTREVGRTQFACKIDQGKGKLQLTILQDFVTSKP